jgi:hypothetical protein
VAPLSSILTLPPTSFAVPVVGQTKPRRAEVLTSSMRTLALPEPSLKQ